MQGIVIQGPTNYYKKIIEHYKHIPNIVWSTWEDEPIDNLKYIENNIPLIVNKKPSFPGYLNVNLQVLSTFSGIEYLVNNNVTEILKIRGDIIVSDIDKLLYVLKGKLENQKEVECGKLQETLMTLNRQLGDKNTEINNLNKKVEELENLTKSSYAFYLKNSNIKEKL